MNWILISILSIITVSVILIKTVKMPVGVRLLDLRAKITTFDSLTIRQRGEINHELRMLNKLMKKGKLNPDQKDDLTSLDWLFDYKSKLWVTEEGGTLKDIETL